MVELSGDYALSDEYERRGQRKAILVTEGEHPRDIACGEDVGLRDLQVRGKMKRERELKSG